MTAQRLEKLQGHTNALVYAFLGLRVNYGLLKPLLGDTDELVVQPPAGVIRNGLSALRYTLFFACVLDIVKLAWDPDREKRAPTITSLLDALGDHAIIELIVAQQAAAFVIPREAGDRQYEQQLREIERTQAERQRARIEDLLRRLRSQWQDFDAAFKDPFMTMRDKHIAHLEVRLGGDGYQPVDIGTLGVSHGHLGVAVSAMEGLVWILNAIVRDADFQMERASKIFDRDGRRFWKHLTA
jgi:hypothetical protein